MVVIMKMIIVICLLTCHGNRSSEGDETGGDVGEVGEDVEGEGGEDQGKAPQHSPQPGDQAAKQH